MPFHRNFTNLKLTAKHAKYISFVELLDIPTIGNKSQKRDVFFKLTSLFHLRYLDRLIYDSSDKLFFVSAGVVRDLKQIFRIYPELAGGGIEALLNRTTSKLPNGSEVHEIYHFSSSQIHGQYSSIRLAINRWLENKL